jgi:hypothetical protein
MTRFEEPILQPTLMGHIDGPRFYEDLHRLGQQYGGDVHNNELEATLETIFDISQRQQRLSSDTTTTTADPPTTEMHSVIEEMSSPISSEEEATFLISTASRDEPSPIELLEPLESQPSSSKTNSKNKPSEREIIMWTRRRKMMWMHAMEHMRRENALKFLVAQEHRRRLAERAKIDEDILRLEQERSVEELETRRVAEERHLNLWRGNEEALN